MSAPFKIVLADPPWKYNDKAAAGKRGAEFKYPVMSLAELMDLRVPLRPLLDPQGSVLFMWATAPFLKDALALMEWWEFDYKTMAFTWLKEHASGKECFGMGNWTRANQEFVLMGVRGKRYPRRINASVRQVIRSQRLKHSEKPPETRDLIVQLMGDLPRLEMFARHEVEGWDRWGNEIENTVELDGPMFHTGHFGPD